MLVKIIFAFSLLAISLFLVCRSNFLLKLMGAAGLLLWLFLGDWGGLELAWKLFDFVRNNVILTLKILGGIFAGIMLFGWFMSKMNGGSGAGHSSVASSSSHKSSGGHKTVYIVDGKEFDDQQSALLYARQFHKENAASFIRREERTC